MLKKYAHLLSQVIFISAFSFLGASSSFANEASSLASQAEKKSQMPEFLENLSQESIDKGDYFKSIFSFPLEGTKGNVIVSSRDFEAELLKQEKENSENLKGKTSAKKNEESISKDIATFSYALKTPYFFTENKELMLDVIELAELYEANLRVTMKEDILTLFFTSINKKILENEVNASQEAKEEVKEDYVNIQFDKEVYTLVVDLDESEERGILSHTVYQRVVEERENSDLSQEPIFIIDEEKSYKGKEVTFAAPIEIIENHVFVPLSIISYFDEIIKKEADKYIASSKTASKENVIKLSKIKNITKEIEKAPEFLSKENFELIYAMIGPAGAAIVLLVFVATYLALKNFYYLTFVWIQFTKKFKEQSNECNILDSEVESSNPLIQLIKEVTSLRITDPTVLRQEVHFIFQRNLEMIVQDLSYIRLISIISPLLGLLGTVLGMVDVFQAIAESASPDPADLAAGIWSALLTTILGLSVAVPTLITYYYLLLKCKRYQNRIVTYSVRINTECSSYYKD